MLEVLNHPLITHKLTIMRNKETGTKDFRENLDEIAELMAYEVCRDLPVRSVDIETPMGACTGYELSKQVVIVPILRAGIGLLDGIRRLIPTAKVGFIGLYRDEVTLEPHEYFCKLPSNIDQRAIYVVDPMLATGGSAVEAINFIKQHGGKDIHFLCIVAAPEGLEKLHAVHPDVKIFVGNLDRELNDKGYICPGLGDCGDRIFGTK